MNRWPIILIMIAILAIAQDTEYGDMDRNQQTDWLKEQGFGGNVNPDDFSSVEAGNYALASGGKVELTETFSGTVSISNIGYIKDADGVEHQISKASEIEFVNGRIVRMNQVDGTVTIDGATIMGAGMDMTLGEDGQYYIDSESEIAVRSGDLLAGFKSGGSSFRVTRNEDGTLSYRTLPDGDMSMMTVKIDDMTALSNQGYIKNNHEMVIAPGEDDATVFITNTQAGQTKASVSDVTCISTLHQGCGDYADKSHIVSYQNTLSAQARNDNNMVITEDDGFGHYEQMTFGHIPNGDQSSITFYEDRDNRRVPMYQLTAAKFDTNQNYLPQADIYYQIQADDGSVHDYEIKKGDFEHRNVDFVECSKCSDCTVHGEVVDPHIVTSEDYFESTNREKKSMLERVCPMGCSRQDMELIREYWNAYNRNEYMSEEHEQALSELSKRQKPTYEPTEDNPTYFDRLFNDIYLNRNGQLAMGPDGQTKSEDDLERFNDVYDEHYSSMGSDYETETVEQDNQLTGLDNQALGFTVMGAKRSAATLSDAEINSMSDAELDRWVSDTTEKWVNSVGKDDQLYKDSYANTLRLYINARKN